MELTKIIFAFVDDLATLSHNMKDLVDVIVRVKFLTQKLHMKLNLNKCGIIFLNGTPPTLKKGKSKDILGIPIVKSYKYMGIMLDKKLNSNLHIKTLQGKAIRTLKLMNILSFKNAPPQVRLHALKSFLLGLV